MGDRFAATTANRLFVAGMGVASERGGDGAFRTVRRTPDQRQIAALKRPFGLSMTIIASSS